VTGAAVGGSSSAHKLRQLAGAVHPWLFAVFPTLSLAVHNWDEIDPRWILRPLLIGIALTAVALSVLQVATRRWDVARVITAPAMMLVLTYGDLYQGLRDALYNPSMGLNRYLIPAVGLTGMAFAWGVRRLGLRATNETLSFVSASMVIMALLPLVGRTWIDDFKPIIGKRRSASAGSPVPNVFVIMLDAYGRNDVLRDYFDFDNHVFLDGLKKRRFLVVPDSRSNYTHTIQSLASSLNVAYLDSTLTRASKDNRSTRVLVRMIKGNQVMRTFQASGYSTINLASPWLVTARFVAADSNLSVGGQFSRAQFESMLLSRSVLGAFVAQYASLHLATYREALDFALERAAELAASKRPIFAFAHVLAPHPPFVFDSLGNRPDRAVDLYSYEQNGGAAYVNEIRFLNKRILGLVDSILARSATPPIILIHSDHGPASAPAWLRSKSAFGEERTSNLVLVYAPVTWYGDFYPGISLVNVYRVLLNRALGQGLEMLPDSSFDSDPLKPLNFQLVPRGAGRTPAR
jgi:hypothetical protein